MYELLVTLCIGGDPTQCVERRVPFYDRMNMMRCMRFGLNHAQAYADERPDMTLKRWRCVVEKSADKPDAGFATQEVAPGVFVHTGLHETPTPENRGDLANIGYVVGDDAVAVIDAGGSAQVAQALLADIRKTTDKPIRYLFLTHMHPDHILGAKVFADAGATVVGHRKLQRAITARARTYEDNIRRLIGDAAYAGTEIAVPQDSVETHREFDLGNRVLLVEAHPTAHTDNDLTVLDRKTGTWFLGDLLFSGHTPAIDGSVLGWLDLMDDLEARKVSRVVPGHGPAVMDWPKGAEDMDRYLNRLVMEIRAAILAGRTMGETIRDVGESERDKWELFDEFNPRNATAAYKELEWE